MQYRQHIELVQQENDKIQRTRILISQASFFIIYLFIALGINYATKDKLEQAKICSPPMARYLTLTLYYFVLVSTRHLIICLLTPCARRP